MRGVLLLGLCLWFLSGPAARAESIRVLILDGGFRAVPAEGEVLGLLERRQGSLLVSNKRYSGHIEVWRGQRGLYIINELPLEQYVQSVVRAEVPQGWELEALKAQAVVVRTYALHKKLQNGQRRYHLTSSVLHQLYQGEAEDAWVRTAVEATRGEVLTYRGRPIEALYHSTCGGLTEEASEVFGFSKPYLKPVRSPCSLSPYSLWARRFSLRELAGLLGMPGLKGLRVLSRSSTGRVKELEAVGPEGSQVVPATELRRLLGWKRLPSTAFELSQEGEELIFLGRGYGHGVGLCQWSALELARQGMGYREILRHFYPGTQLHNIYAEQRL
jgi:stage II sporulation protein D